MLLQPYLHFEGRCDEALEFYKQAIGAKVEMLMRYKDSPDLQPDSMPPGMEDKVMHASVRIGETNIFVSDGRCQRKPNFDGFTLSLTVSTAAEADQLFAALSDGGQVHMPLAKTFFSSRFGMLADRFGVSWLIMVRPGV